MKIKLYKLKKLSSRLQVCGLKAVAIYQIAKPVFLIALIIFLVGIFGIVHQKSSLAISSPVTKPATIATKPQYTDFHLVIPSLNIAAPVILDVDGGNKTAYFKALQSGVAHFAGTAKPGENSNIFIFGHSSYYSSDPGKYKTIFVSLGDLKKGDEIDLWYNLKEYKYFVSNINQVAPNDVSVLRPTSSEQLTLMTCWPPGTTTKRLIVVSKPT